MRGIQKNYGTIYYTEQLNKIFIDNNIEYFNNIQQAEQFYGKNDPEKLLEVQTLIDTCMENYRIIYEFMNQKYENHFYNR
jgi:hypothetical protein